MQRSIATVSLAGTLVEKLHAIARAGFKNIEIFEPDLHACGESVGDIARLTRSLGLRVPLYQPFRDFEGMPKEHVLANLEQARRTFDDMNQLGCGQILLCSNTDEHSLAAGGKQVEDLGRIAELAQRHGVKIGFEALAWGRHIYRYQQAWARVKEVNSPALGLVLDSFHILALGDRLNLAEIPLDKIFFVQLADAPHKKLDVQQWSRHYRCFPGEGGLPVLDFAGKLSEKGYRGPWSLEIFNDKYQRLPPDVTAQAGFRSLQWLEEQAGCSTGGRATLPSALRG
ncbi:MAG TPA: sugar phosphate isomerase/epimerase [Buttiauxella sp.]|jgi:4-hydroxyphenylpyruvate dioxygenase